MEKCTAEVVVTDDLNLECMNLGEKIEKLKEAIQQTKKAKSLAKALENKGYWETLGGVVSGSNIKEMAESMKLLCGSVHTTQVILDIVLKINNAKNQHLKAFYNVITEKIIELEKNTSTLNSNQCESDKATLYIAKKLQAHIAEKIEYQEKLIAHDSAIAFLKERDRVKSDLDDQQSAEIKNLISLAISKDELDRKQSKELRSIKDRIANIERSIVLKSHEISKERKVVMFFAIVSLMSILLSFLSLLIVFNG
ncbi:MAG: hypothetical protein D6732_08110 [Methanobacteriota archaeon]|nr:MAG: hypothetical protein D6732_08110 [Euryarchaeota archaeon]